MYVHIMCTVRVAVSNGAYVYMYLCANRRKVGTVCMCACMCMYNTCTLSMYLTEGERGEYATCVCTWNLYARIVLVLFPDPALKEGKGLVYIEHFLECTGFSMSCDCYDVCLAHQRTETSPRERSMYTRQTLFPLWGRVWRRDYYCIRKCVYALILVCVCVCEFVCDQLLSHVVCTCSMYCTFFVVLDGRSWMVSRLYPGIQPGRRMAFFSA